MQLINDASVMHVVRKFIAAMMAVSLLFVTAMPTVSAAACAMPDMGNTADSMQVEPVSQLIDWQDCVIECGCRVDNHIDGMPHQLAPHALSMTGGYEAPAMQQGITMAEAELVARLFAFSPPPPRSI
ncbi:MAG: hypothetical protein Q9M12_07905 [Mariprofundus sp.]|nr:hypothetical protein [Mariprofundus sp.]